MAVARYNGEEQTAERELAAARELVAPDFTEADYITGTNIAHFQFLRYTIPRQFLPQVDYPAVDPALLRLLENS